MKRITTIFIFTGALLGALCIYVYTVSPSSSRILELYFLDIGQGDAVYVRSPSGQDMLIDGGPSSVVLRRLAEVMPWSDRTIDVVVETHPDADHIGGLPDVLKRYTVGMFVQPGIESKNSIDDEITRLLKEQNIPSIIARRGMVFDLGQGVFFNILFPDRDVSSFKDTNEASIIGQIVYGSSTVMLTGDAPSKIEIYLVLQNGVALKSDILKAGHHGSRTSSSQEFVKMVQPLFSVISAGKDNRYKHPHQEVIDMFLSHNIDILRTDKEGTIRFISDGKQFTRK